MESLFKGKFGLSSDEALLYEEDMVDVIIPEGRDQNDYLFMMATDRGINSRKLPVAYVPASVTKDLQLLKLKTVVWRRTWRSRRKRNLRDSMRAESGSDQRPEGSITKNYKAVQSCSKPISGSLTQVVVLRHYGEILFPRLVGLIYLK
ncbi:hypothetical protein MP228_007556 [Amoeboaphelidium protococcarum]|nr:hypothetical protein MP228_007556 [Amoeboaphelidium protococcarum]